MACKTIVLFIIIIIIIILVNMVMDGKILFILHVLCNHLGVNITKVSSVLYTSKKIMKTVLFYCTNLATYRHIDLTLPCCKKKSDMEIFI